ncbi:histidine phosphatase family protein [Mycolicibacterium sp. 624]|uniref:histidine phosphatase family protein n=1 Tax=Mycolicibacterium sp. 624 TaxID=3156314 RepID=UPI0033982C3D
MSTLRRTSGALATLILAACLTAAPAAANTDPDITITFVRHGESQGNASGRADTSVPGPSLTPLGEQQAKEAAVALMRSPHDGVYASTMIRTQQTAQPFADDLREQIVVLPGLREIEAGDFEGQPEQDAGNGFYQTLTQWMQGDRDARIPGSIDGNEFEARFTDAVNEIYHSGHQRPVVFAHGGSIAVWTMMNVVDPPLELAETQPLPNTGQVVVRGNPTDGWTLLDWNGTKIE